MKIIAKFIYYPIILCMTVSCAQTKESKTKSDIINYNAKIKPSLGYSVQFSSLTRSFNDGFIVFILDEQQIYDKIFEILSESDLFSFTIVNAHPIASQDEADLEKSLTDYHFSINIGWDEETNLDEFVDEARTGWVAGSLGLFPVTVGDEIVMDIYVTSQGVQEKHHHYEESTRHLYWAPISLVKAVRAKSDGYKLIFRSEKFTSKIEEMMNEFIEDFSKALYSK